MQIHDLIQGSPEWLAFRRDHRGASEAPAMLGVSPYKTRDQLLREYATGITAEIDAGTQQRFNEGHRIEAAMRVFAEQEIGESLYPVVMSRGKLSASLDGGTLDGRLIWECKTINDAIRAAAYGNAAIPEYLRVQMEQQLHVSGAERCLFSGGRLDADGNVVESIYLWYYPDLALRARIIAGWEQFEADLAEYVVPAVEIKAVAAPILALPALAFQIKGEVVASNLPAFQKKADEFIAGISTTLVTDEDFAQAEANVRFCADTEERLAAAKQSALGQTASIDEILRTVDHISEQFRQKRLALEKLVDAQKKQIKEGIVNEARTKLATHVAALNAEVAPIVLNVPPADFVGAIKGKRTIATLRSAVNTELANGKIAADQVATSVRRRLAWFNSTAADHKLLFPDLSTIIQKADDDFQRLVLARIDEHKAAEEARATARLAEEQRRGAEQDNYETGERATGGNVTTITLPAAAELPSPSWVAPTPRSSDGPPSLRTGDIAARLGFSVTVSFLEQIGVAPAERDKSAALYREGDFQRICAGLVAHVQKCALDHIKQAA